MWSRMTVDTLEPLRGSSALRYLDLQNLRVRDASLVQRIPMRSFGNAKNVKPGMQFQAQSSQGQTQLVTVTGIQGDIVTVDANHPLAGENLHFDVEITDVRDASQEELEHGHGHGAGGHHHHD